MACAFIDSFITLAPNSEKSAGISTVVQKCSGVANLWPTSCGVELPQQASAVAETNFIGSPACSKTRSSCIWTE